MLTRDLPGQYLGDQFMLKLCKSAACWVLSAVKSLCFFSYYYYLEALDQDRTLSRRTGRTPLFLLMRHLSGLILRIGY